MPPKGLFDCCGYATFVIGSDGKLHPVNLGQTVTLTPKTDDEWEWHQKPINGGGEFTISVNIPKRDIRRISREIRREVNKRGRIVRRAKRLMEKERRKRLKEGHHEPR